MNITRSLTVCALSQSPIHKMLLVIGLSKLNFQISICVMLMRCPMPPIENHNTQRMKWS